MATFPDREPIISVRQPWASAILHRGKTVENRSWSTLHRGRIWIHAAKQLDAIAVGDRRLEGLDVDGLPRGVILGSVDLVDVIRSSRSPWAARGMFHWVLRDPQPLCQPVAFRGRAGLTWFDPFALGLVG